jgi:hypothetical protein
MTYLSRADAQRFRNHFADPDNTPGSPTNVLLAIIANHSAAADELRAWLDANERKHQSGPPLFTLNTSVTGPELSKVLTQLRRIARQVNDEGANCGMGVGNDVTYSYRVLIETSEEDDA